jgi:beta-N-acetylhexosaminidase
MRVIATAESGEWWWRSSAMVEACRRRGGFGQRFPGQRFDADSHPWVLPHDEARLRAIEFVPFQAAIQAGVKMIMTAHIALPNVDDGYQRPATLSPRILKTLLRDEMKFSGVVISDAMDMHAVQQGPLHVVEMVAGAQAGLDLLLLTSFVDQPAIYEALLLAARHGLLNKAGLRASVNRIAALKQWVAQQMPPDLDVIGCATCGAGARNRRASDHWCTMTGRCAARPATSRSP